MTRTEPVPNSVIRTTMHGLKKPKKEKKTCLWCGRRFIKNPRARKHDYCQRKCKRAAWDLAQREFAALGRTAQALMRGKA